MTLLTEPASAVRSVLAQLLAQPGRWASGVRFDPDQRWYHRLPPMDEAPGAEVWLLSWLPGQHTGLHDHGGAHGGFAIARGALRETTVSGAGLRHDTLEAGRIRTFGSHHVHEVTNDGPDPAISIHVYAPGLTTMSRYAWTDGGLSLLAVERAGDDW